MKRNSFPCHGRNSLDEGASTWTRCPDCGTMLRRSALANPPKYDDDYPREAGHFDPDIGDCKRASLERWTESLDLDLSGDSVCEIGFGAGWSLAMLQGKGARVTGLEPVKANREHAAGLGIPSERLFDAHPLPRLPFRPTMWLFQDSFEHIPDPSAFLKWLSSESCREGAGVLLVAPEARSPSQRLMGPLWLHNGPDHWVHYTREGILDLFRAEGFVLESTFNPAKLVSLKMTALHLRHVYSRLIPLLDGASRLGRFWFNMGEMGLYLKKTCTTAPNS